MPANTNYTDEDVFESLKLKTWEREPSHGISRSPLETSRDSDDELEAVDDAAQWYPAADRSLQMPTQGRYPGGHPKGAVVHFTAGRCDRGDPDAAATVRYGATQSHCYFCISRTGKVYQTAPLSRWGYHAGKSYLAGIGNYVHARLAGIELCNAGLVKKTERGYEPYWNKPGSALNTYYGEDEVRFVERTANVTARGHYQRYTPAQEQALVDLLVWMHESNPEVFELRYVVGHDEVSPDRKNDPGGALSLLMPAFRERLAEAVRQRRLVAAGPRAPAAGPAPAAAPAAPVALAAQPAVEVRPPAGITFGPRFGELLLLYAATAIDFPHLKAITFAQWAHETGFGTSELARRHLNFAGMKWREAMRPFAEPVTYRPAHDPKDTTYCGFTDLSRFIAGYWHRLDIPALPYASENGGWRRHAATAESFLDFIGPIWAPSGGDNSPLNNGYIRKVWDVHRRLDQGGVLAPLGGPAGRESVVA